MKTNLRDGDSFVGKRDEFPAEGEGDSLGASKPLGRLLQRRHDHFLRRHHLLGRRGADGTERLGDVHFRLGADLLSSAHQGIQADWAREKGWIE